MNLNLRAIDGYVYGAIQPTAELQFSSTDSYPAHLVTGCAQLVKDLIAQGDPGPDDMEGFDDSHMPALMCRALDLLNRLSGDQRFTPITSLSRETYLLPTLSLGLTRQNLQLMGQVLNKTRGTVTPDVLRDMVAHAKKVSFRYLPGGTNPSNFIAAAGARKVPMKILSNGYLAFGYGSGSVIFDSSITDQEKSVGVGLARSKVDTNAFLKLSGFPVVEQQRITTLEQAQKFAETHGYPVVLKPENEEQGRGIYANITGADDLAHCFESATKTYKNLIMETHAPGDHYRVDFMGDQLIKAVRRRRWGMAGPRSARLSMR